MPTTITVPVAERTKSIQYGAAYSSALSFNPDKALLVGCSAVLSGMGVSVNTGPTPNEATVAIGAFIQNGIIIDLTSPQTLQFPASPISYPLYLVAENANETYNSSVQILFTTTPAADSVIIAEWATGPETDYAMPIGVSNCALRDAIGGVQMLVIQRDRIAATPGQTLFTLGAGKSYVQGANKIWVYRNGKKLDISNDYVETSTTSITVFQPALTSDIFEFMIFKGAPPITSIALTDLTDVTTDLANAIKDTSILRISPATAANPLATLLDVGAVPMTQIYVENLPTFSANTGGVLVPVGVGIPVTLTSTKQVMILLHHVVDYQRFDGWWHGYMITPGITYDMSVGGHYLNITGVTTAYRLPYGFIDVKTMAAGSYTFTFMFGTSPVSSIPQTGQGRLGIIVQ